MIIMMTDDNNHDDDENDADNDDVGNDDDNNNIVLAFSLQLLFYSELLFSRPNFDAVKQLTVCILFGKISPQLHKLILHTPLSY